MLNTKLITVVPLLTPNYRYIAIISKSLILFICANECSHCCGENKSNKPFSLFTKTCHEWFIFLTCYLNKKVP